MLSILVFVLATAATLFGDDFSDGNHQFSAALYEVKIFILIHICIFNLLIFQELIVDSDDNVLVSPFAIETLVAIAQSGAVGATGEEIRNSLYLPESQAATEKALKSLISEIEDDAPTFLLSNTIEVDSQLSINADFAATASDVYQAQTSSGSAGISLSTDLVFRANFATAFKLRSEKQLFMGNNNLAKSETMFLKAGTYNYAESTELDAQILEIPFSISTVSLTIVLPNKESGIGVLEKNMKSVLATPDFSEVTVDVTLPTFRIATKTDFAGILENVSFIVITKMINNTNFKIL